jgi:hypothetical protein
MTQSQQESAHHFPNIESAYQYVCQLTEALTEEQAIVEENIAEIAAPGDERRVEALRLVSYKLGQLKQHLEMSRRLLNDLRTLRRLLQDERSESRLGR